MEATSQNMEGTSYTSQGKLPETKERLGANKSSEDSNKFSSSKRVIRKIVVLEPSKIKQLGLENKIIQAVTKLNAANVAIDNSDDGIDKKKACWNFIASDSIALKRTKQICQNKGQTQISVDKFHGEAFKRKGEIASNKQNEIDFKRNKVASSATHVEIEQARNILNELKEKPENKEFNLGGHMRKEFSGFTNIEISEEKDILNRFVNAMVNTSPSNNNQSVPKIRSYFNYRKCLNEKLPHNMHKNTSHMKYSVNNDSNNLINDKGLKDISKIDDSTALLHESNKINVTLSDKQSSDNFGILDNPLETSEQPYSRLRHEGENSKAPTGVLCSKVGQTLGMCNPSNKDVIILDQKIFKSESPLLRVPTFSHAQMSSKSQSIFRDELQVSMTSPCSADLKANEKQEQFATSHGVTNDLSKNVLSDESRESLIEIRSPKKSSDIIKNICKTYVKKMTRSQRETLISNKCKSVNPVFGKSILEPEQPRIMISGSQADGLISSGGEFLASKNVDGNEIAISKVSHQEINCSTPTIANQTNNTKYLNDNLNNSPLVKSYALSFKNNADINLEGVIKTEPMDAVEYILNCTENHNISNSFKLEDESDDEIDWRDEEICNNETISSAKEAFPIGEEKVKIPTVIYEKNNSNIIKPKSVTKKPVEQLDIKPSPELLSPPLNVTLLSSSQQYENHLQISANKKSYHSKNVFPSQIINLSDATERTPLKVDYEKSNAEIDWCAEKMCSNETISSTKKAFLIEKEMVKTPTEIYEQNNSLAIKPKPIFKKTVEQTDIKPSLELLGPSSFDVTSLNSDRKYENHLQNSIKNQSFHSKDILPLQSTIVSDTAKRKPIQFIVVGKQDERNATEYHPPPIKRKCTIFNYCKATTTPINDITERIRQRIQRKGSISVATQRKAMVTLPHDNHKAKQYCPNQNDLSLEVGVPSIESNSDSKSERECNTKLRKEENQNSILLPKIFKLESPEEEDLVNTQNNEKDTLEGHVKVNNEQIIMDKVTTSECNVDNGITNITKKPSIFVRKWQKDGNISMSSEQKYMEDEENNLEVDCPPPDDNILIYSERDTMRDEENNLEVDCPPPDDNISIYLERDTMRDEENNLEIDCLPPDDNNLISSEREALGDEENNLEIDCLPPDDNNLISSEREALGDEENNLGINCVPPDDNNSISSERDTMVNEESILKVASTHDDDNILISLEREATRNEANNLEVDCPNPDDNISISLEHEATRGEENSLEIDCTNPVDTISIASEEEVTRDGENNLEIDATNPVDTISIASEEEVTRDQENSLEIDCTNPDDTISISSEREATRDEMNNLEIDRTNPDDTISISSEREATRDEVNNLEIDRTNPDDTISISSEREATRDEENSLEIDCTNPDDTLSISAEQETIKDDANNFEVDCVNATNAPSDLDISNTEANNYLRKDNLESNKCLGEAGSSQWHTNENCKASSLDVSNLMMMDQKSRRKRKTINRASREVIQTQQQSLRTSESESDNEILQGSNSTTKNKKINESKNSPKVVNSLAVSKNKEIAVSRVKNSAKRCNFITNLEEPYDHDTKPTIKEIIPIKENKRRKTTSANSRKRSEATAEPTKHAEKEQITSRTEILSNTEPKINEESTEKHINNDVQKNKCMSNDYCINPKLFFVNSREEFEEAMRSADQHEGNNEKIAKSKASINNKSYRCGGCGDVVPKNLFNDHIMQHYGVGWRDGLDKSINITSYREVLNMMCYNMKRYNMNCLKCKICGDKKKSAAGFLVHIQTCLLDKEQLDEVMQACEFCSKSFFPPALWTHKKTCRSHAKNKNNYTESSLQSNGEGSKRKAAIKAANIVKTIMETLPTVDDFIKEYQTPRGPGLIVKWKSEIKKYGAAKCFEKSCTFETDDITAMKNHAKYCLNIRRGGYSCLRCMFYDIDKEKVHNHVLEKHGKALKTATQTVEKESGTESNDISVTEKDLDSSEESSFDEECEVQRPVGFRRIYDGNSYEATQRIHDEIHSNEVLYADFMPTNPFPKLSLIDFKLNIKRSVRFGFTKDKYINKFVGATKAPLEWTQLEQGEVKILNGEAFVFIGGPVTNCAWAPKSSSGTHRTEYLAVSFKKGFDSRTKFLDPIVEDSLILVYKVDLLVSKKLSIETKLLYGFQCPGPVHHIEFMPSGGFAPNINRLGLLAVATVKPNVDIFALPLTVCKANSQELKSDHGNFSIVDLKPSLVLCVDLCHESKVIDDFTAQSLRISWSEIKDHNIIAAGFSNGFAGLWDIRSEDNLTKFNKGGIPHYVPLSYFNAVPHAANGIALHYTAKETRWIMVSNRLREFRVYDLADITNPLPLVKDSLQKGSISCTVWPLYSENPAYAINDDFVEDACSVFTRSVMNVNYKSKSHIKCPSGVNTLCFTPWKNALIVGCNNGDIILQKLKTLSLETSISSIMPRKHLFFTDIVKLDGQPIPGVKARSQKKNLDSETIQSLDVFQDKYNESYGLIFGGPASLSRNDRKALLSVGRVTPFSLRALTRVNCISLCSIIPQLDVAAIGYNNGMIRIKSINYSDFS